MDTILNVNTFDAVIIGLIILLSLKGLISGFTKELFGALGIIGGIFTATFFNKDVAQYVSENFTNSINIKILELLSLILIFLAVFLLMKLIYKIIATLSKDDYISLTSRIAGMLIKMITLFFIFSLIVYSFSTKSQVTEKFKTTLNKSRLYPLLKNTGAAILNASALTNETSSKTNETNSTNEKNSTKSSVTSENNVSNKEKNAEENITKESLKDEKKENIEKNISTETEIKTDEKNDNNESKVLENNNSKENNIKTVIENNKTKNIDENISKNPENNKSEIEKNNTLELNSTKE